ncbi:MAG: DUF4956 domain-containing protein [Oscillospiraceae bacterium]|jgi:uncharacterized membrane protein YhiD involved in acid resistance|nr:DUF4956 domain-containing protein [Oscillospiraceae bacterium]
MSYLPLAVSDLFKSKVLDQLTSTANLSPLDMLLALLSSFAIGMLILLVYRVTFRGVIFSKSFAFSLVLLGMITSMVIATITSNLALSLGMVGALSIVRFRTAVKDPVDTVFMFWAIANGIMCGAGLYIIGVVGTAIIGALYVGISKFLKRHSEPYLLVVRYNTEYEKNITWMLQNLKKYRIKSKTIQGTSGELALEINQTESSTALMAKVQTMQGIEHVSLVSYESEFGL